MVLQKFRKQVKESVENIMHINFENIKLASNKCEKYSGIKIFSIFNIETHSQTIGMN